jgi:hypothetical protein
MLTCSSRRLEERRSKVSTSPAAAAARMCDASRAAGWGSCGEHRTVPIFQCPSHSAHLSVPMCAAVRDVPRWLQRTAGRICMLSQTASRPPGPRPQPHEGQQRSAMELTHANLLAGAEALPARSEAQVLLARARRPLIVHLSARAAGRVSCSSCVSKS